MISGEAGADVEALASRLASAWGPAVSRTGEREIRGGLPAAAGLLGSARWLLLSFFCSVNFVSF